MSSTYDFPSSSTDATMNEREELLVAGLEALLAAIHADDPKREILVRVGDAIREVRSMSVAQGVPDSLGKLSDMVAAKIEQLEHYREYDCQLDHAKTIADGRISQAIQILHWIAQLSSVSSTSLSTPPASVAEVCAGGVDPGWDECPKCGASMDDACAFAATSREAGK